VSSARDLTPRARQILELLQAHLDRRNRVFVLHAPRGRWCIDTTMFNDRTLAQLARAGWLERDQDGAWVRYDEAEHAYYVRVNGWARVGVTL
jgi:hypothetical protein